MADSKRVSYLFSESARRDIRWLSELNKRSMTKELEFLIQQAADAERQALIEWAETPMTTEEVRALDKENRDRANALRAAGVDLRKVDTTIPYATLLARGNPKPPTLRDGHNYDSLSYSAKHRASQARAARDAARAVRMKAAKEREDAYANAPKDWSSDPS